MFGQLREIEYKAVNAAEVGDSDTLRSGQPEDFNRLRESKLPALIQTVFFIAVLCIAVAFGAWLNDHTPSNPDAFCTRHVSQYCKW